MVKTLTARAVDQAKAGAARREIPDGLVGGMYLVVQPSGAKSWALRYRHGGKPRKLTLGRYPALGLGEARDAARDALLAIAKGSDPAGEKVEARRQEREEAGEDRDSFRAVAALFIERYAKRKNRSWQDTERLLLARPVPRWGDKKASEITRRDVVELLDDILEEGREVTANRTLAAIRKLFSWSVERGIVETSPCAGVKAPAKEVSRERILSDDEVRWFWKATDGLGWPFGPLFRLLLLSAQRRDEVGGMTWRELALEDGMWMIPSGRAKNATSHTVPLPMTAAAILEGLPHIAGPGNFVFTTNGKAPVSGFSRAKTNLDAKMLEIAKAEARERGADPDAVTIPEWRLHDLRRTAASGMARLGIAVQVVEKVLNHRSGSIRGVAAIYNRYEYGDEKRAALEAWARFVAELVGEGQGGNVVRLAARS